MRKVKISIAVSLITLVSIAAAGPVAAAEPNPHSCMGKDMGLWAREGSDPFADPPTGLDDFDPGAGWGEFVADQARLDSPFGADNWGAAMKLHLDGVYSDVPGVTCGDDLPE